MQAKLFLLVAGQIKLHQASPIHGPKRFSRPHRFGLGLDLGGDQGSNEGTFAGV